MKKTKKGGKATTPDNQREPGTGAGGGGHWAERTNTYRKLARLCLIMRKVTSHLKKTKHHHSLECVFRLANHRKDGQQGALLALKSENGGHPVIVHVLLPFPPYFHLTPLFCVWGHLLQGK